MDKLSLDDKLKLIVDEITSKKEKTKFQLSVASQAKGYQSTVFRKAQQRYKIYNSLYKFIINVYKGR